MCSASGYNISAINVSDYMLKHGIERARVNVHVTRFYKFRPPSAMPAWRYARVSRAVDLGKSPSPLERPGLTPA